MNNWGYLDRFVARVRNLGLTVEPHTIQSNGGLMSIASVRVAPVRTCLSGPAAGVVGAAEVARAAGFRNLVTFDVGGTSTDVSLVSDLKPLMTSNRAIADYPVKVPMIDIHVIGAGGGSIAWMDDAGALKVGPRSAGADPGPAAYGAGGTEATLTDANICLRRLNPVSLLGGRMPVDEAAARHVVEKNVARPAGLDLAAAAHGILRIAIANMSRAIRSVSTEKGYDIKEFALFAYGGAGPLHAAEIALECNIPRVVVPQEPGTMCARGMLLTDVSFDFVRSEIKTATKASWRRALKLFDDMVADGNRWLDGERVPARRRRFVRTVEARYQGQNYEVKVPLAPRGTATFQRFLADFAKSHAREYGYAIPGRDVEIVNCRVQAIGRVRKAPMPTMNRAGTIAGAVIDRRSVYFGGRRGWVKTRVLARDRLPTGQPFAGPAIVEEMSSTTVILPGQIASVDPIGNLVIDVHPRRARRPAPKRGRP